MKVSAVTTGLRRAAAGATPLAAAILLSLGCAASGGEETAGGAASIRIVGSDTMRPLLLAWAESYMKENPPVSIYVKGGGSARGIEALIENEADLCAASRAMLPDEVKRLLDRRGFLGLSILTAKDALSVYLHPANPLTDLTRDDLKRIFTGRVSDWSELGGPKLPVHVVNRQPNSGSYFFFRGHVLGDEEYGNAWATAPNTAAVVRAVSTDTGAIGYGGIAYGPELRHASIDGVAPTAEDVRSGAYPLARYLYLYAAGPLEGELRRFVDWILSDAGQRRVIEVGYIPLWDVGAPAPLDAPAGID